MAKSRESCIPSTLRPQIDFTSMLSIGIESLNTRLDGKNGGLQSGYAALDEIIGGFHPEEFVTLGGSPGCGKSTVAMNICQFISIKYKRPAVFFSMTASRERLAESTLASLARVDLERIRAGKLDDEDWTRISSTISAKMSQAPLYFDTTPALTTQSLYTKITDIGKEGDVALAVVDYPHLMRTADDTRNEAERLAEISRDLKAISKELRMTILAVSPLNRSPLFRADGRPQMSDLRGAGSLEDDADTILLLHRPDRGDSRSAEVIVGKQRHGIKGTVELRFFGEYARFDSCLTDYIPEVEPHALLSDEENPPINESYINEALGFGFSSEEMLAFLEEAGLVIRVGRVWQRTEQAKPFLHPNPAKGRIWRYGVINFLRSSRSP